MSTSAHKNKEAYEDLIRESGERATKQRVALMSVLSSKKFPVTIKELAKNVRANQSTLYRSLEVLVSIGLVKKIHLDGDGAYYEIHTGRKHHHHIQCLTCGVIEDIDMCNPDTEKKALNQSKKFSSIKNHSLEFFGMCNLCTKQ